MKFLFSFKGEIGRGAYAAAALGVLFLQHAFSAAVLWLNGNGLHVPWWFWLSPLRVAASRLDYKPDWLFLFGMVLALIVMWSLLALSYRRSRRTAAHPAWILFAAVPGLQIFALCWLIFAPSLQGELTYGESGQGRNARAMAAGTLTGAALCLAVVAFSTLVLGIYGYGLFLASPFVIGITVAEMINRQSAISLRKTVALVLGSLGVGALVLMGFALEGAICLLFASPLIAFMGFLGAAVGWSIAETRRSRRTALMSVALLPLLMAGELLVPPHADFESVESIEIAATPEAVWHSIVNMNPIPDAPAAPFRWGLAYPMRGEINGSGVGAVRRGVFSTGVAYERVVTWVPGRQLDFIVLSDPPSMRELSPYEHVHAPHDQSYFRTRDARFTITPLADGRARLTLATDHDLDLEPALYWLPIAHWAIHANKVRVLRNFRRQAEEQQAGSGG